MKLSFLFPDSTAAMYLTKRSIVRPIRRTNPRPRKLQRSPTIIAQHTATRYPAKSTPHRTHICLATHDYIQRPLELEHTQAPRALLFLCANYNGWFFTTAIPNSSRLPT
jgi:hypothetical protein